MKYAYRNHFFSCQICVKADGYELEYLFPAQPSPIPRHNGKCNNFSFNKEIKLFEGWCFVISLNLVLASEMTNSQKHFVVKSISIDL